MSTLATTAMYGQSLLSVSSDTGLLSLNTVRAVPTRTVSASGETQVTEGLVIPPLNDPEFLHEKNLLLSPSTLSTPVQDQEVLQVFRQQTPYLVDRARMWVRTRRAAKTQGNKKS